MPSPDGWMTLAEYAESDRKLVAWCTACDDGREMHCRDAAATYGPGRTWPDLEKALRCRDCTGPLKLSFPPADPSNVVNGSGTTRNGPGVGN